MSTLLLQRLIQTLEGIEVTYHDEEEEDEENEEDVNDEKDVDEEDEEVDEDDKDDEDGNLESVGFLTEIVRLARRWEFR